MSIVALFDYELIRLRHNLILLIMLYKINMLQCRKNYKTKPQSKS